MIVVMVVIRVAVTVVIVTVDRSGVTAKLNFPKWRPSACTGAHHTSINPIWTYSDDSCDGGDGGESGESGGSCDGGDCHGR